MYVQGALLNTGDIVCAVMGELVLGRVVAFASCAQGAFAVVRTLVRMDVARHEYMFSGETLGVELATGMVACSWAKLGTDENTFTVCIPGAVRMQI